MSVELKAKDDGSGFQIVEEGKDPIDVKPEELVQSYRASKADITGQTLEVTVAGKTRTVTVGEAMKAFEKVGGADKALEEAAVKQRDAGEATRMVGILKKMNTEPEKVSADEFQGVLEMAGVPADQIAEAVEIFEKIKAGGGVVADAQDPDNGDGQTLTMDQLPPEVRLAVATSQDLSKANKARTEAEMVAGLKKNLQEALTSNKFLTKILVKESDGKPINWGVKGSVAKALFDDGWEKVLARVGVQRQDPNPALFEGISQELRNRIEQSGKLFGRGPGQDGNTSLGPALVATSSVEPKEPPERVSVGEPGRSENFRARLRAKFHAALAGAE